MSSPEESSPSEEFIKMTFAFHDLLTKIKAMEPPARLVLLGYIGLTLQAYVNEGATD